MYCVKCGVELADSEKKCPLCGTPVFHPAISQSAGEPPFPPGRMRETEKVSRLGWLFVVTVLAALSLVIMFLCDWCVNTRLDWFGYAGGAVALLYVWAVLPQWFTSPNPAVLLPMDFAAAALYLFYINMAAGGRWFLPFALPVTAGACLIVGAVAALLRYVRRGQLFIIGGALIASGAYMVLVEYLLNRTFRASAPLFWSVFPLAAGFLLGLTLIVIGLCRPLREALQKRFFI